MASRNASETAGSGESDAGRNGGIPGSMKASAESQPGVIVNKLDIIMSEVTDITYKLDKLPQKVEETRLAGQSGDSSSNCSQTSTDKIFSSLAKALDELNHHKLPDIESKFNASLNELRNQFLPCLEARFNLLFSSQGTNLHVIESRLNALESSQNELHLRALVSIESRLSKLESSQNQTTADVSKRLKELETSVNTLHDQDLTDIVARFNSLKSSLEELEKRQNEDKAEAKNDVHELAAIVEVFSNENLSDVEAKTARNVAERFGMKNTVNKLSNFIRNTVTIITCIQLFKQEFEKSLITHRNAALRMILENFNTVSESATGFCELSLEEIRCFIYSSELRVTAEQMFNAISKWVEKDRLSRTPMASLLLPAVQFSSCSLTFLRRIRDDYLVRSHSTVQFSVEESLKKFGSDVLFVLGGYDSNGIIETLNNSKSSWIEQKDISKGTSERTRAFTAGHQILALEKDNERFRSFDTLTKEWTNLQPLPVFRYRMSAAMEGNEMVVMGGLKHESRCDAYDFYLNTWTKAPSLNVGRWWPASSSHQGKIYCCGGKGNNGLWLSSMEVLDPKIKSKGWTLTTSMSVGRGEHCLVSCSQYLWAVGGYDGSNRLSDLERFEPSTKSWTKMAPMLTRRCSLTACFLGGQVYAIGGWNGERLNTVEVYDPGENRWTTGVSLNNKRSWPASCVVKELSNADEYQ